jgi:hypothetical protein
MAALPRKRDSQLIFGVRGQHGPPINVLLIPPLAGLRFLDRSAP